MTMIERCYHPVEETKSRLTVLSVGGILVTSTAVDFSKISGLGFED
jgi:hypothetical protein